ncbi:MAG: hypothetical protein U5O39_13525 [Gammaproteobacteria bacterium]|nr:hypothetical protein [Gammaproteobacteria bacterium]
MALKRILLASALLAALVPCSAIAAAGDGPNVDARLVAEVDAVVPGSVLPGRAAPADSSRVAYVLA